MLQQRHRAVNVGTVQNRLGVKMNFLFKIYFQMQVYETLPEDRYLQLVLQTHKQEMQTFSRRNQILPQTYGMLLVGNSCE